MSPLFIHNPSFTTLAGTLMAVAILITFVLGIYLFLNRRGKMSLLQKLGWFYAVMFLLTTTLPYIPGVSDDSGHVAGLFKIDLIDDLLHLVSVIWAIFAAWHSTRQVVLYFRVFGLVYLLDGIIGVITQRGALNFGVWLDDFPDLSLMVNIAQSAPHILIGGVALVASFVLKDNKSA